MQIVLRGVAGGGGVGYPAISFIGPGIPVRPFWSNFNNTVPGSTSDFSWGWATWDEFSRGIVPPGWTVYQAVGDALLPPPVSVPDPEYVGMGLNPYVGYTMEGYANHFFNSLNNVEWFAGHSQNSTDPATGLQELTYEVYEADEDGDYPAYIRNASHILYMESNYFGGYETAASSAAFIDIIDGASVRTFDLSTATYMPVESDAQSYALWDGRRDSDFTTHRIYYLALGNQPLPPDIFWTRRVLCEET